MTITAQQPALQRYLQTIEDAPLFRRFRVLTPLGSGVDAVFAQHPLPLDADPDAPPMTTQLRLIARSTRSSMVLHWGSFADSRFGTVANGVSHEAAIEAVLAAGLPVTAENVALACLHPALLDAPVEWALAFAGEQLRCPTLQPLHGYAPPLAQMPRLHAALTQIGACR